MTGPFYCSWELRGNRVKPQSSSVWFRAKCLDLFSFCREPGCLCTLSGYVACSGARGLWMDFRVIHRLFGP